MHRVMIHPASYESCREAVARAFDLFPQAIAGKTVVMKPNVLRSSAAGEHIVTHPSLLRAVNHIRKPRPSGSGATRRARASTC